MVNINVYKFAVKWLNKFQNRDISYHEIINATFAEECKKIGFKIDERNIFNTDYDSKKSYNYVVVGNVIYSTWNSFYRSKNESFKILDYDNRNWFINELNQLAILALGLPYLFKKTLTKITIISNNINFGPKPYPDDEVEQSLVIENDGNVEFIGYNYEDYHIYKKDNENKKSRVKNFHLTKENTKILFEAVTSVFSNDFEAYDISDIGDWKIQLVNNDGVTFTFFSALNSKFDYLGIDLADLIRKILKMDDLILFDNKIKPDKIIKIVIDYFKYSDNNSNENTNYSEQLIIDRNTKSIEYQQNDLTNNHIISKYENISDIDNILDEYYYWYPNNDYGIFVNTNSIPQYNISIHYERKKPRIFKGNFDKDGLPKNFDDFIETISKILNKDQLNEIFNSKIYNKTENKKYIYCSVTIDEDDEIHYYLTKDETIKIGDWIIVPTGRRSQPKTVEVVNVEYFSRDEVPKSLERTRWVISKASEKDIEILKAPRVDLS